MQLIYVDEAGINYRANEGVFRDGPFVIYTGLFIDDTKYFHLERLFNDLINDCLGVSDWNASEIHACDIWACSGNFSHLTKEKAREFFEETFQLLSKLWIRVAAGIQHKTIGADAAVQKSEITKSIYCLLHSIEECLSESNETGIIISDFSDIRSETQAPMLSQLLKEKTNWRYRSGCSETIPAKYKYESRSCFILDNIHYVDSKNSLFNQIADIVAFVIKRVTTFCYMKIRSIPSADINQVPVTVPTFNYFSGKKLVLAGYSNAISDVVFWNNLSIATSPVHPQAFFIENFFMNYQNAI